MKKNWFAIILLSPFSILFAGIISLRNIFYETGLLKATSFSIPIINVGNLSVGGTGKTPHIEYLIRLLSPYLNVATLSRGYKRKSKGFRLVSNNDNVKQSGDEPLQFKTKYPSIPVAVSESRNIGIPLLIKSHPETQTILLDDAFQHRSVVPGLNILLTEYNNLFTDDYLMPSGRLREPRASYERANVIVVTKCDNDVSAEKQAEITKKINPLPHQKLFFSKYNYAQPYYIFDQSIKVNLSQEHNVVLISAIANVDYLLKYLESKSNIENIVKYEDHHYFSDMELEYFKKMYDQSADNTLFLTTEKDAMRLSLHKDYLIQNKIPIFALPVEVDFLNDGENEFNDYIKKFLLQFKV
ncbi:MAG: tetraacyldisaccharide 4'-kinase [Saprospiraceae bacterium]|nr:tetraacyldisaccharide 4'-kinase [Bacteroidia bacterium]NNE13437.1 tetraacyldisaccharide 4'-kinase [Saprospiraceae bacterium]NNL93806.1 tetraacyldisaccharide 4'-kinase [Saprospiraceae bacterium]